MVANIIENEKGRPYLHHEGCRYGLTRAFTDGVTSWRCTSRKGGGIRNRCNAFVHTKMLYGVDMLRVQNPKHTCVPTKWKKVDKPPAAKRKRKSKTPKN